MVQQLLAFEVIAKGGLGVLLVLAPATLARICGLPRGSETFWPRLCGGILIAIAGAAFLQGQGAAAAGRPLGLGLGGLLVINLTLAAVLTALLTLGAGPASARGRLLLLAVIAALLGTALVELAYV